MKSPGKNDRPMQLPRVITSSRSVQGTKEVFSKCVTQITKKSKTGRQTVVRVDVLAHPTVGGKFLSSDQNLSFLLDNYMQEFGSEDTDPCFLVPESHLGLKTAFFLSP